MAAFRGSGRAAEAVAAYEHARQLLSDELGTGPGTALRSQLQLILAGAPAVHARAVPAGDPATDRPHQLPSVGRHFTGRTVELAALTELLDSPGTQPPGAVAVAVIAGTPGVGKTALAVHWAHQSADRFPDGQLHVNLRGYDLRQPVSAADVLARFLRALGMPGQQIPADPEDRAAAYRSRLAGRRILIVLDNARDVEQVRPLLPGTSTCVVIVTSRDALAGLVAREGAVRVDLDLLPHDQAVGLLRVLIGDRAVADQDAAERLASSCCHLPLALRVAAELAVSRPAVPLADLAGKLADQHRRLDLLDAGGDARSAVRAVFSWSCHHLDDDAARMFRLVSLHPGADFDGYAAAAIAGTTLELASDLLDQLVRAHLIQPATPGRWDMHDLLRDYARELAGTQDSNDDRQAALSRLFDYYLHTASTAMDALFPAERQFRPVIAPSASPAPPVSSGTSARAWLDAERDSLVAATIDAASRDRPDCATGLSLTLQRYLEISASYAEAVTIHTCARSAARRSGDRAAEAHALSGLGTIDALQCRYALATDHFQQALTLYSETGDQLKEANALNNLGIVQWRLDSCPQAVGYFRQAMVLYRRIGYRTGEARALNNLGLVHERLGRYRQAADHFQQALALYRETGDRTGEARALNNLGMANERLGSYAQATTDLGQALVICRQIGFRTGEADALNNLGTVDERLGHYPEAADRFGQALAICHEIGDQTSEAVALNGLGEVLLATGHCQDARTRQAAALCLAIQVGDRHQQARAHHGLGRACLDLGDLGEARHHWQLALTLYTEIGAPDADQVRGHLDSAVEVS
jgi:tetratricopeptide (TPR) repeat protein